MQLVRFTYIQGLIRISGGTFPIVASVVDDLLFIAAPIVCVFLWLVLGLLFITKSRF